MKSQAVIEAESRQASTINRSAYNAVKHGLTAKTAVFPWEDPEQLQATIDFYKEHLGTLDPVEEDLALKAAIASWQHDRAIIAQVARAEHTILTTPKAKAEQDILEAETIRGKLFHDRRGPIELYPSGNFDFNSPRTSWTKDADDPDHPRKLIVRAERTVAGRLMLPGEWGESAREARVVAEYTTT